VPAGSVTASLLLISLLIPAGAARAQTPENVLPQQKSELRRQLEGEIMCTCGCRAPMNDCPMGPSCHGLQELNAKLDNLLGAGMDHDAVLAALVSDYGQSVLLSPPNKGFNRLAWLLPYALGVVGLGVVVVVASRWSRHGAPEAEGRASAPPVENGSEAKLSARLDDELRDLD
jgi:cytochrome c-type biogenesis protein CcmH/NrfF